MTGVIRLFRRDAETYSVVNRIHTIWEKTPQQVRRTVRAVVPNTVKDFLRWRDDRVRLRTVPTVLCHTESLRSVGASGLRDLFGDREIDSLWRIERVNLDRFCIPGGIGEVSPGERRALFYIISALRPVSVLEIGTHVGASTVHIALAMKQYGSDRSVRLVSVDRVDVNDVVTQPWRQYGCRYSPVEMIDGIGFSQATKFVIANSLDYLRTCTVSYDLVFLDGDHRSDTVYQEIPLALQRLKKNGVVVMHDYYRRKRRPSPVVRALPGPYLAVRRLSREGAELSVQQLGPLPWHSMPHTRLSSLALLLRDGDAQSPG